MLSTIIGSVLGLIVGYALATRIGTRRRREAVAAAFRDVGRRLDELDRLWDGVHSNLPIRATEEDVRRSLKLLRAEVSNTAEIIRTMK